MEEIKSVFNESRMELKFFLDINDHDAKTLEKQGLFGTPSYLSRKVSNLNSWKLLSILGEKNILRVR